MLGKFNKRIQKEYEMMVKTFSEQFPMIVEVHIKYIIIYIYIYIGRQFA